MLHRGDDYRVQIAHDCKLLEFRIGDTAPEVLSAYDLLHSGAPPAHRAPEGKVGLGPDVAADDNHLVGAGTGRGGGALATLVPHDRHVDRGIRDGTGLPTRHAYRVGEAQNVFGVRGNRAALHPCERARQCRRRAWGGGCDCRVRDDRGAGCPRSDGRPGGAAAGGRTECEHAAEKRARGHARRADHGL